jgi:hypothetical protein
MVLLLPLLHWGNWTIKETIELTYQRYCTISYILRYVPKEMPIHQYIFVEKLSEIKGELFAMLDSADPKINS